MDLKTPGTAGSLLQDRWAPPSLWVSHQGSCALQQQMFNLEGQPWIPSLVPLASTVAMFQISLCGKSPYLRLYVNSFWLFIFGIYICIYIYVYISYIYIYINSIISGCSIFGNMFNTPMMMHKQSLFPQTCLANTKHHAKMVGSLGFPHSHQLHIFSWWSSIRIKPQVF